MGILLAGGAGQAFGQAGQPALAEHLNILWQEPKPPSRPTKKKGAKKEPDLKGSCQALAKAFGREGAFFGHGPFETVSCANAATGKVLVGKKAPSAWLLIVSQEKTRLHFELSFSDLGAAGAKMLKVASLTAKVKSTRDLHAHLQQGETASLAALALLDQMPFAAKTQRGGLRGGRLLPLREFPGAATEPPEKLVLYDLAFDSEKGLWRSDVKGFLVLKTLGAKDRALLPDDDGFSKERGWILEGDESGGTSVVLNANSGDLFIQDFDGPGARAKAYTKEFQTSLKVPLSGIQAPPGDGVLRVVTNEPTAAFGVVARGMPLVDPAAILLPKARLWRSALTFRGQGLRSLAAEFDVVPQVNDELLGKKFRIGWYRLGLGVELGLDPGFLANWIFVTPRLGAWQLDAVLPIKGEDGAPLAVDYGFKLQAALGFRAGVEFPTPLWTALRLSLGREVTSAFLSPGGGASGARTENYGIELFFRGLTIGPTVFPYLFVSRESAVFSLGKASELDLVKKQDVKKTDALKQTFFDVDFAGAGLGIAW